VPEVCPLSVLRIEIVSNLTQVTRDNWRHIAPHWAQVDAAVRDGVKALTASEIKHRIIALLNESDEIIPKTDIKDLLKQDKSWSIVKKMGSATIPSGNATQEFNTLIALLRESGIFWCQREKPRLSVSQLASMVPNALPKFSSRKVSMIPNSKIRENSFDCLRVRKINASDS